MRSGRGDSAIVVDYSLGSYYKTVGVRGRFPACICDGRSRTRRSRRRVPYMVLALHAAKKKSAFSFFHRAGEPTLNTTQLKSFNPPVCLLVFADDLEFACLYYPEFPPSLHARLPRTQYIPRAIEMSNRSIPLLERQTILMVSFFPRLRYYLHSIGSAVAAKTNGGLISTYGSYSFIAQS